MITIIEYNTCNVGSIKNILKKIQHESVITNNSTDIKNATKLILPGVGSFDKGIQNLNALGLSSIIKRKVEEGTPILGICLGYQLFAKNSEEGIEKGLGIIDAEVKRFRVEEHKLRVPHMGWNEVECKVNSQLFKNLPDEPRFYFVHSYHVVCENPELIAATTLYGNKFHSAIEYKNIYGVQFHPEKSHKYGMALLDNFANL